MTTINQNTINAAKRLIKFIKESDTMNQAVFKLVEDENHVQLSALESMPLDDIITAHWGNRKAAIEQLEALLKSAEA